MWYIFQTPWNKYQRCDEWGWSSPRWPLQFVEAENWVKMLFS
jgi:hypothetical protein